jgi:hypothetical protein
MLYPDAAVLPREPSCEPGLYQYIDKRFREPSLRKPAQKAAYASRRFPPPLCVIPIVRNSSRDAAILPARSFIPLMMFKWGPCIEKRLPHSWHSGSGEKRRCWVPSRALEVLTMFQMYTLPQYWGSVWVGIVGSRCSWIYRFLVRSNRDRRQLPPAHLGPLKAPKKLRNLVAPSGNFGTFWFLAETTAPFDP